MSVLEEILVTKQAEVARLSGELEAAQRLLSNRSIAALEVDNLRHRLYGQQQKVEKLQSALAEQKTQANLTGILLARQGDLADTLARDGQEQLKPPLARIAALQSAVEQSAEVARIERLALEVGSGTQSDYLDAEANLLRARADLIEARHAEISARVELARVLGELSPEWLARTVESAP